MGGPRVGSGEEAVEWRRMERMKKLLSYRERLALSVSDSPCCYCDRLASEEASCPDEWTGCSRADDRNEYMLLESRKKDGQDGK